MIDREKEKRKTKIRPTEKKNPQSFSLPSYISCSWFRISWADLDLAAVGLSPAGDTADSLPIIVLVPPVANISVFTSSSI